MTYESVKFYSIRSIAFIDILVRPFDNLSRAHDMEGDEISFHNQHYIIHWYRSEYEDVDSNHEVMFIGTDGDVMCSYYSYELNDYFRRYCKRRFINERF